MGHIWWYDVGITIIVMNKVMHWFIDPIKNQYADFAGRTTRQEFWMYILVYIGIAIAVGIVAGIIRMPLLSNVLSLVLLVPSLAITARRLHDVDRSGWWQLIGLIPVIGVIILIVWCATKGDTESNQFGAVPVAKTGPAPEAEETPAEPEEAVEENTQKGFEN